MWCVQCTHEGSENRDSMPEYSGVSLKNIFYPLGGIGTGNILIGGRGNILEFEIFNRAQRDELPPYMTFFSLWYQEEGKEPGAMVLERKFFDDFDNGFGQPRQQLSGLPRFHEACWSGAPPRVGIEFEDGRVPLKVRLECFNPLIPLDVDASSIPLGEFAWEISNPGGEPVDYSMALNISNPFKNLDYRSSKPGHPVRNTRIQKGALKGIFMENLIDPEHPDFGNMVVATDHDQATVHTGLTSDGWWDDAHILWGDFSDDGQISEQVTPVTNHGAREEVASLLVRGHLEAGESDTVRFYLTWLVPNRVLESTRAFGAEEIQGHQTLNYYASLYANAWEVLETYMVRRDALRELSNRFYENLTESTVPSTVLDAAVSNLAILKSNLLSRVENGDVHGYEGMGPDFGCCPGNCTHVWNYAQTMASLFPSLERNVRETAFLTQTFESGYQCFRTTFPIGDHHFRNVAADGQMGNIMRVYREWKFSGDSAWLARLWPSVKRSIEYAWNGSRPDSREGRWTSDYQPWDPERTGVLTGKQHNTDGIDFYGTNKVTGGLFRKYRSIKAYAGAPLEELREHVSSVNFYRNKASNIKRAAGMVIENFSSRVPRTMEELITLPGVARKTANIVLSDAYGIIVGIAVDTHVLRLSGRLGLSSNSDPVKVERDLMDITPDKDWATLSLLLILHGRNVCKARNPMHSECSLSDICPSVGK